MKKLLTYLLTLSLVIGVVTFNARPVYAATTISVLVVGGGGAGSGVGAYGGGNGGGNDYK